MTAGMEAMTPSYPQRQAHNPFRPPDWRWQRAQWLVEDGRYHSQRRDDEPTGEAVRYLRTLARRPGIRETTLQRRFPAVHAARRLHEVGGRTRWFVEASLLARQTSAEVARRTGVAADVVDVFESLFFHVRQSLNARDWILIHAIGISACTGAVNPDPTIILKHFAYHGGPLVLEAVRPYLVDGKDLFDPPVDLSTPQGRREQSTRLAVAAQMLPRGVAADKRLQKIMLLLRERDHKRHFPCEPAAVGSEKLACGLAKLPLGVSQGHKQPEKCKASGAPPAAMAQVA